MRDQKNRMNSTNSTEKLRVSIRPALMDARAFLKMTNKQQANFVQMRFAAMDSSELANIVRAIYGHPYDRGRPRRDSASTSLGRPSLEEASDFAKATLGYRYSQRAD